MQQTSELYKRIKADPEHTAETMVTVAGTAFDEDQIGELTISRGIFAASGPAIGCCVSAQLDLTLWADGRAFPKMAEIRPYTRLCLGDEVSEWLPKGVYYISERHIDDEEEMVRILAYDAMLKGELAFLQEGDTGEWPRSVPTVVSQICRIMGVELDSRTVLSSAYTVGYPNDYTCRELLGYIAAMHGGNWIVTEEGKLLLLRLGGRPADTHYLVTEDGDPISLGGVRLLV